MIAYDIYKNDDNDTRREMLELLQKLTPAQRLEFLHWAIWRAARDQLGDQTHEAGIVRHRVRPGTNGEDLYSIYWDCSLIIVEAGLSVEKVMLALTAMVRGKLKFNVPITAPARQRRNGVASAVLRNLAGTLRPPLDAREP